ncbi:hypothetical protein [Streptomyces galbus]|uniref:Uncharacterized protein n=1 Tax=Streptomyces galbus TaxID=33898 RepID=A0A4U5X2B6_STRGB|nr:hypothetical protein [Streptomyces galbus]TKT08880.1 hypothetical protein E4U92_14815 [Streptomyces galbus]GHD25162.1 hypothetical protein GCM10010335_10060 [Streptomyces galbus]
MSEKEPDTAPGPEEPASVLSERLKERIYASLTLLAVLIGLVEGRHVDHTGAVLSVAVTALACGPQAASAATSVPIATHSAVRSASTSAADRYLGGRRIGSGPLRAAVTAALNTGIGLVVVGVKLLAGH